MASGLMKCLGLAGLFLLATLSWAAQAFGQDDRVLLQAGAASFRVPEKYLLLDYREGGVEEPILANWFGFSFWLNDRAPGPKERSQTREGDVGVRVVGVEAKVARPEDKRLLPAHRIWELVSHPLLYDYTRTEEFGLQKHKYCVVSSIASEDGCAATYTSRPGTSPQLYARGIGGPEDRVLPHLGASPWQIQVFYPEDRIVFWLTLPGSALARWKAATDGAIGLLRSWRVK
jgi:hypothetical protein